ncbi:MAG TPA: adenine phosphoribosyltransferase [candidate division Zixibacteria bacterium]|nr:adenine phosphoribosyltransferase [candidate division Zixibacteria bacterium]
MRDSTSHTSLGAGGEELKRYIRSVPDFPRPGINFYDITTLLQNPAGFRRAVDQLEGYVRGVQAERILAIESRGFFFGAALADRLGLSIIPARKPGKLPYTTVSEEYELEYGTDRLEVHADAVLPGDRVVVVDDLIAIGGTLLAACRLVERLGGVVAGVAAVIDLRFLPWREKLSGYDVRYLVSYDSE